MATEPRLSSKWLINIAWLNSIISLPVPTESFLLKLDSMRKEYQPYPPPLQVCLDNIVPPVWPKTFITKGLQGTSPLVQRSTALCLAQVLEKYDAVLQAFREAESALEEDEESGQWKLRRKDIEREIRKRIPNFEVIIAFSQQKSTSLQWGADLSAETSERTFRSAMISESALRLMWAYHHFLPDVPSEARYDVGKLLLNDAVQRLSRSASNTSPKIAKEIALFDSLSVLHILRLLQHSDQIVWTSTLGKQRSFLELPFYR
jgi:nucleolar pre-ribosomal-associated protein 1